MPTINTIGIAGRNYSTIPGWQSGIVAGGYIGELYNDSEFVDQDPAFSGLSPTDLVTLRCAAGQSAFDNVANPLRYDITKGVGIKHTGNYSVALLMGSYTVLQGVQVTHVGYDYHTLQTNFGAGYVLIERSLFVKAGGLGIHVFQMGGLNGGGAGNQVCRNCVFIAEHATVNGVFIYYTAANTAVVINCTIVSPPSFSNSAMGIMIGKQVPYIANCAMFGFATAVGGYAGYDFSGTSGSNNATDKSSIGFGTNNVTSLVYANQFVDSSNTGTMDFKLKTGSDLIDVGSAEITYNPALEDIFKRHRPQGTAWDIGAHEYPLPPPPPTPFRNTSPNIIN